jgi:hypothetical protein
LKVSTVNKYVFLDLLDVYLFYFGIIDGEKPISDRLSGFEWLGIILLPVAVTLNLRLLW